MTTHGETTMTTGSSRSAKQRAPASARTAPDLKRKNLILDQAKIDRAKTLLGAATETEAITRALDAVSDIAQFRADVDRGLESLAGAGGFADRVTSGKRTRRA